MIAEQLNALRVVPRGMFIIYMVVFYQVVHWFMAIPDPTLEQTAFVGTITAVGTAWFGLYTGSGGKK